MNTVTIATDNASNMVAAFRDRLCRLRCFAHCLNLVVTQMLAVNNDGFKSMLASCKTLVRHFKHTGLQLRQEVAVKTSTTHDMMFQCVKYSTIAYETIFCTTGGMLDYLISY